MNHWLAALLLMAASATSSTRATAASASVELHGHRFSVELATDNASREQGLMMRTQLAADHGMLFVFNDEQPRTFWMKNTLIPLDILYFGKNHRLVSVQRNALPCKADPCRLYPSDGPARYVLELRAGTARAIGAEVGDTLNVDAKIGEVE